MTNKIIALRLTKPELKMPEVRKSFQCFRYRQGLSRL